MIKQFVESKVATKVVVNNPSLKMDNSVEGDLLRIAQLSKWVNSRSSLSKDSSVSRGKFVVLNKECKGLNCSKDHKRVIKLKDKKKKHSCEYGLSDNCFYHGYWGY